MKMGMLSSDCCGRGTTRANQSHFRLRFLIELSKQSIERQLSDCTVYDSISCLRLIVANASSMNYFSQTFESVSV